VELTDATTEEIDAAAADEVPVPAQSDGTPPALGKGGRPGVVKTCLALFQDRRDKELPLRSSIIAEAREIIKDWPEGTIQKPTAKTAAGRISAAQHGLHSLAAGRRLVAGELVPVANGSRPTPDGTGLAAAVGEPGEVGGDDPLVRWQGCGAPEGAPGGEVAASPRRRPPGSPAPSPPRRRPWWRRSRPW
jgi:hypothetical protein